MIEFTKRSKDEKKIRKVKKSRKRRGIWIPLKADIKKYLKWNIHEKSNIFWVLIYPLFFIAAFTVAFSNSGQSEPYNIAIINEDNLQPMNMANASLIITDLFDPDTGNGNLTNVFHWVRYNQENQELNITGAQELLKNGELTAILVIPNNFTEVIIGNTWWYPMLKQYGTNDSYYNPTQNNSTQNDTSSNNSLNLEYLVTTEFPINKTPQVILYSGTDLMVNNILSGMIEGIINQLVAYYNGAQPAKLESISISQTEFRVIDYYTPGILIVGVTVAIMMVSQQLGIEKQTGLLHRLDTTPTPRWIHLVSISITQLIYSSVQISIIFGFSLLFGLQLDPNASIPLMFLITWLMALTCIGLGVLIAAITKDGNAAGGISWMVILPIQFFGGAFFPVGNLILRKFVPSYYAIQALKKVLLIGLGITNVLYEIEILILFAFVFLILGIIIFQKRVEI